MRSLISLIWDSVLKDSCPRFGEGDYIRGYTSSQQDRLLQLAEAEQHTFRKSLKLLTVEAWCANHIDLGNHARSGERQKWPKEGASMMHYIPMLLLLLLLL